MNLLCLGFGHDGLAAVFKESRLVGAIASERITRIKKHRGVNQQVVDSVLDQAGLKWADIQLIVVMNWFFDRREDGTELFDRRAAGVEVTTADGRPITRESYVQQRQVGGFVWGLLTFHLGNRSAPCFFADHHFAHCAYAFYMSGFDHALAVSIDGSDNFGTRCSVHYFNGDDSKIALRIRAGGDFAIGGYYALMCDCLGFYPSLTDCGKVMALAAYGTPIPDYAEICRHESAPPATFAFQDMFLHSLVRLGFRAFPKKSIFSPALKGEGGTPDPRWLDKNDWNQELNRTMAATTQAVFEKAILDFLKELADSTRKLTRNLCLSGGAMLNCVCNGKVLHSGLFENVFLAPASSDDGGPIGAGLYASDNFDCARGTVQFTSRRAARERYSIREAFEGGRRYSEVAIEAAIDQQRAALEAAGITVRKLDESTLVEFTADRIIADRIVGWFYRGSELGPRALGHRSLLANPRNPAMKDILNKRVKHREEFRPFAPAVLRECADEWFDLRGHASPFMLFSVACRRPAEIPSAVHIDGSARVQTVDRENNGRFYDLIACLYRKTGVPVVLNTSFNVQGEPIVETPGDAIRCFLGTEIDVLVLEQLMLEKGG